MTARPEHLRWLADNGRDLAPLTGQDARALAAIDACWQLYASGDDAGRTAALAAVRCLALAMQPKCRSLARDLIARSLDWGDQDKLWPRVAP